MRQFTDDHDATVYNLQSTDDNKESTIYRCKKESTVNSLLPIDEARWNRSTAQDATIYKDAKRCSKMKWKACNGSTNGSTDQRINGSKSLIKIANRQNENVKKSSCLEDALKCPAEYEYCCSIVK